MTDQEAKGSGLGFGKKIFLSGLLLFVALLLLEAALQLFVSRKIPKGGAYGLSLHTQDGVRISKREGPLKIALAPFRIFRMLPGQKTDSFTINSLGFRGPEVAREPGERARCVFVGGSAAFGLAVANDDSTIPRQIEQADAGFEVINAGVPGYLSGQELVYVTTELIDLRPDWVIAYDGWNDMFDQWYSRKRGQGQFGITQNFFTIEGELESTYQCQTRLGSSLRSFFGTLLSKTVLLGGLGERLLENRAGRGTGKPVVSGAAQEAYFEAIVAHYTANLRKMNDVCRARGIRFLAVFQPEAGQKPTLVESEEKALARGIGPVRGYRAEFPPLYRRFLDRCGAILAEQGIEYIDVSRAAQFLEGEGRYFIDVVHTERTCNRIVADLILERLRREE